MERLFNDTGFLMRELERTTGGIFETRVERLSERDATIREMDEKIHELGDYNKG